VIVERQWYNQKLKHQVKCLTVCVLVLSLQAVINECMARAGLTPIPKEDGQSRRKSRR
jgi:hypothetical protein